MDKVTNRKAIMTQPFGTIKRNDCDIQSCQLIDFFHSRRDKGFFRWVITFDNPNNW